MSIKKIGIISKPKKLEIREIVPPLLQWLRERDIDACIDKETGAIINTSEPCLTRNEMPGKVDLLMVLGGDGTLLATARALKGKPVPILAVNLGGLGFLTVITQEELYPTLEGVLRGEHRSERRVQIEGSLIRADEVITSFLALNDAVLNKGAISRILDFELRVNGQFVSSYKSDGFFLARATRPHSPNPHLGRWTIPANLPIARPTALPVPLVRLPPYPHFGFSPEPVS